MKRTTTALGLAMLLLAGTGCQSAHVAGGPGKSSARSPFLKGMGLPMTPNGFTPLYPLLVSEVTVQSSDARIFEAGDPTGKTWDFTAIVMPHPTRLDIVNPPDPKARRTVSFTPYNSMPSMRLHNGMMYLTGRWRVPATVRVRGGHDGASIAPPTPRASTGEPEGGALYDGLLLVWVWGDEEWWFWQPTTGSDPLFLALEQSQTPMTDMIPAKSYVRIKMVGTMAVIAETHPFNNSGVPHDASAAEVFAAAYSAAVAAGVPRMDKLSP